MTVVQDMDIGTCVSGIETGQVKFGVWKNDQLGQYRLSVFTKVKRFIVLKTTYEPVVLNLESNDLTDAFYDAFTERLKAEQAKP